MCHKNIAGRFFGLVTKHACDGQTDRQNYDSQDHASIAASRGKNYLFCGHLSWMAPYACWYHTGAISSQHSLLMWSIISHQTASTYTCQRWLCNYSAEDCQNFCRLCFAAVWVCNLHITMTHSSGPGLVSLADQGYEYGYGSYGCYCHNGCDNLTEKNSLQVIYRWSLHYESDSKIIPILPYRIASALWEQAVASMSMSI